VFANSNTFLVQSITGNGGATGGGSFLVVNGGFTNTGTVTVNGLSGKTSTVTVAGTWTNAGTFTANDFTTLTNNGTIVSQSGTFTVPNAATITNYNGATGTLTGGTWRALNAGFNFGGRAITTLASTTTVELSGASAGFAALTPLTQNNGLLRVLNGAFFAPTAALVNTAGTIEIGTDATFAKAIVVQSAGVLRATGGSVTGPVTVQTGGRFSSAGITQPLTTPGNFTINGGSGTIWDISFNGVPANTPATASTQAGRLALTGSATLNQVASSSSKINLTLVYTGSGQFPANQQVNYIIASGPAGSAGSAFKTNGGAFAFDPNQYSISASNFSSVQSYSLIVVGDNLVLQFVPVPEPTTLLAVIAVGAAGGRRARRRLNWAIALPGRSRREDATSNTTVSPS
jgi:hypothetical protein